MVPTATSPSAQPAIVKIRRVDALIPLLLFVPLLLLLLLLLVFTRLPRYFFYSLKARINIPRSRRPRPDRRRRRCTFALPPTRVRLAADTRSPCRRRAFAFAFTLVQFFKASKGPPLRPPAPK